jgi:hypothetical protein
MITKEITVAAGASLSNTFESRNYCIVAIQTTGALTTGTTGLVLLACADGTSTPIVAVSNGTAIVWAVVAATAQYLTTVEKDMVKAPLLQLQCVDSTGAAKAQTNAATFKVVMAKYLS